MTGSHLSADHGKLKSRIVTYADLTTLAAPVAMGQKHQPVPHVKLVDGIMNEIATRGMVVTKQQFAVSQNDAALFGVIDLQPQVATVGGSEIPGTGLSFGFRNSTDQSLAIKAVAGTRVFVCDNLALSGDMIALARKNTTGIDLADELRRGFDKFCQQAEVLATQVKALAGHQITDDEAKVIVFDAFAAKFLPVRLMDDVAGFYFQASDATPDCQPRTLWGLHNAFTRALKSMKPVPAFEANLQLGKHFGLASQPGQVVQ